MQTITAATPPPFRIENQQMQSSYATPPAFLMRSEPIVEVPMYFSTLEDEAKENESEFDFTSTIQSTQISPQFKNRAPLLIALVIAIASGGYLITQIKRILKEPELPRVASVEKNRKR
jgi:hypothetical protein